MWNPPWFGPVNFREENHRCEAFFSSHQIRVYLMSMQLFSGGVHLDHLADVVSARLRHWKISNVPFPLSTHEMWITKFSPLQRRGFKFHLLEEEVSKDLSTYIKTTTVITIWGEILWIYAKYSLWRFCLHLVFTDKSCLEQFIVVFESQFSISLYIF